MDPRALVARLERFPAALRGAVAVVDATSDVRWKPGAEHWSVLEICCHLLDEEREDFRVRARSTLGDPSRPWPTLQLDRVAEVRRYNERELGPTLSAFDQERAASVAWLKSVIDADWSRAYEHPKFGPISAGDLLAAWAAHDALHLRQIAKRIFNLAERDGAPHRTAYAGDWSA